MKFSDTIRNDDVVDIDDEIQLINLAYAPRSQVMIDVQIPIDYVISLKSDKKLFEKKSEKSISSMKTHIKTCH